MCYRGYSAMRLVQSLVPIQLSGVSGPPGHSWKFEKYFSRNVDW